MSINILKPCLQGLPDLFNINASQEKLGMKLIVHSVLVKGDTLTFFFFFFGGGGGW